MKKVFESCNDAVCHAIETKTFGMYYAEVQTPNLGIHVHDCCEILIALCGGKHFLIDGKTYNVSDGDIFILNQYEPHKIVPAANQVFARFVIQIHPGYLFNRSTEESDLSACFYTRGDNISHKIVPDDQTLYHIEQLLLLIQNDNGYGEDIIKAAAIDAVLAQINRLFANNSNKEAAYNLNNDALRDTISYINSHYAEPLSLDFLSKKVFISPNRLGILFKKQFGTTVSRYILSKRISEAKKCLSAGMRVSETAAACGFTDYANFIRSFKKAVGISPGKYGKL